MNAIQKIFLLSLFFLNISTIYGQEITGSWSGTLDISGVKMRIVFNIDYKDNVYVATLDSPDQGVKGLSTSSIGYENQKLSIKASDLYLSYDGVLQNDTLIEGNFKQGGLSIPLNLVKKEILLSRPQEPQLPYSYHSEDIEFCNKVAKISLSGTITYPKVGSNYPAVILVSGSGPQNRNEELLGHKPFLVISDYLTRQGIAVLRYDDRGCAKSEGDFTLATTRDFASDALSAFNYLKARKDINSEKIGIIGHSEGGTIAFMMASENRDIAYVVSLAGSAVRGDSLLYVQRSAISKASGMSDFVFMQNEKLIEKMVSITSLYPLDSIKKNIDEYVSDILPPSLYSNNNVRGNMAIQLISFASPWMRFFYKYDPKESMRTIECPVFALNGDKDLQVDAALNLGVIRSLVKHATIKEYPELNHLFQHCKTGLPNEYGQIEETISSEVLEDIADWIKIIVE